MKQTTAQIYLADQRGCSPMDWFRSFHTFNFGAYFHENKMPFGALHLLNDDTLAAEKSLTMKVESDTEVLILPLVGGFEYKNRIGQQGFVETGQALTLILEIGMSYEIMNPYEAELINFLQIWNIIQNCFTLPQLIIDFSITTTRTALLYSALPYLKPYFYSCHFEPFCMQILRGSNFL